ncbi:MAG: chloride channel protein [Methanocellales archaeon]
MKAKTRYAPVMEIVEFRYLRKWVPISIVIGIVAGIGAIIFYEAISLATSFFLGAGAGYLPPSPMGEGTTIATYPLNPYFLPLIAALGGFLSGLIVYTIAPEAEGHGTDAAIDAFHHKKGEIKSRVPLVKLIASALIIGSGGSAGREGPIAQIGAGFGSFLARMLNLSARDRRIALACGMGAGVGAIFKAPMGGALLSAEILYREDFEVEALVPGFIASSVAYSLFASIKGWEPIFGHVIGFSFTSPEILPAYALLGLVCGLIGIVYIKAFYGFRSFFHRLKIPNYLKPAIGGFAVGVIGIFLPQVLGMGYGWLQLAMQGNFTILPMHIIFILIFAKILATSLSIGSGGSGGVFAPSLFIGGMTGGAVWYACTLINPHPDLMPAAFVIVGMMAFFGGVGKAPIAVILMVSEMTWSYALFLPSMVAVVIAYVLTGKNTIYQSQLASRAESPAHRVEYSTPLLQRLKVKDAMTRNVITIAPNTTLEAAAELLKRHKIKGLPVIEDNKIKGVITLTDIMQIPKELWRKTPVESKMSKDVIIAKPDESLYDAFMKMVGNEIGRLPVVELSNPEKLVGIITRIDIGNLYDSELKANLERKDRFEKL